MKCKGRCRFWFTNKFEDEVNHPKKLYSKATNKFDKIVGKIWVEGKNIIYVKDEIPPTLTNLINDNYGVTFTSL
jgi:hypothetical protein